MWSPLLIIELAGFPQLKMGVLDFESGSCDGMVKGGNAGEDKFQSMIDVLDFPTENLEGDDDLAVGWDAMQSLGPIPTEAFIDLPPVPQGIMTNGGAFSNALRKHHSLVSAYVKPKQLPNYGKQSSKSNIHHENAPSHPKESGIIQTQSPVSVLETGGSCPAGKSLLMKPDIMIPVRSRSKRGRATMFNPWFAVTPVTSATPAYKKAAGYKNPRGRKENISEASFSSTTASGITDESLKEDKDMYQASYDGISLQLPMKKCSHCQVTKTPQWREGPMGPKTLCNACGVRYRSGRLYPEYRPLASPTFVPTVHSNSHRKVVEMRKKTIGLEDGTVEEAPVSPPMEFMPQHSYSQRRKLLVTRSRATLQEKDLPSPDFVPKRRKVMGTNNEGLGQEDVFMLENINISSEAEPALDRNVSTKFTGMRKKAIEQETDSIPDTPMSPAPEFVPMSGYLFDLIY